MFGKAKYLRTFLTVNFKPTPFNHEKASHIILSNLKYLRVLSFHNYPYLYELPDLIGELVHLRYLDLSGTYIKTLPDSLCSMYNLQTLKMICCERLTKLPNDMHNLVNLRHLDISGTRKLQEMPRQMRKLNRLQHLSCFVVGKHEEKGIKELGTLSDLHGSLSIKKLENINNSFEALDARIMDKKYLEELELEWSEDVADDVENSQSEMDILGKLQPAKYLKRLDIRGYRGTRFPEWVGHPSYHNLTKLFLYGCHNCFMLPSLGQIRSLKNLTICGISMLRTVEPELFKNDDYPSDTPFPSLEHLKFNDMSFWEV